MVIVNLFGGLGNQMFQYAAARRLAHVNQAELKLDTGWFGNGADADRTRNYGLGVFNIEESFATPAEVRAMCGRDTQGWPRLAKRILNACGYQKKSRTVQEQHYHFSPDVLQRGDNVYLDGYWQSPRYFQDVAGLIRNEFTFRPPPAPDNAAMLANITGCESVSLHVRRGDYVSNPQTAQYHGTCGLDYYARCVDLISGRVSNPHFFVFSDDPGWVRENLSIPFSVTFISHNGPKRAYEDLRLMGCCRHNIIANSSFSWWGAWLNANPDKIVLAPERWFSRPGIDTRDLLPEAWLRVES